MSDSNLAFDKPGGMPPDAPVRLWPKTKSDGLYSKELISEVGVPMVITLAADARVGDVVNTLVFLPGGRTRKLGSTLTQHDINAGRISLLITDLAPE